MISAVSGFERLERGIGVVRARFVFHGCTLGSRVSVRGHLHVVADGEVNIGDRVQFVGGMFGSEIVCARRAELSIGASSVLNYGLSIHALQSIRIGKRCLIASLVMIRDHDGDRVAPVVIGDDVWIAHGASVEPGVSIGDGSIVSAGSVVTSDIPPESIAIGNPATTLPIQVMRRDKLGTFSRRQT